MARGSSELLGDLEDTNPGRRAMLLKVARMYHEQGLRQPAIAESLHLSQSRVSRLLKEAGERGIVKVVVSAPQGTHPELEDAIRDRYGLVDVMLVSVDDDDEAQLMNQLGVNAGTYFETTLTGKDVIGLSSWSATLLAAVQAMTPSRVRSAAAVVQMLGGVGQSAAQVNATRLASRLAQVTGAEPHFLPAPGLVGSKAARDALLQDPQVADTVALWADLTVCLVGIGSLQPSPLLKQSGNSVSAAEMEELRALGAVGDVVLRFIDAAGRPIGEDFAERIVGIGVDEFRAIPRRIAVAGGTRKYESIRGVLRGGWINVLITDIQTGRRLAEEYQEGTT